MKTRISQFLFTWRLAYGGILLAIDGMREMSAAADQQRTELPAAEPAGTVLLRELRNAHGIDS